MNGSVCAPSFEYPIVTTAQVLYIPDRFAFVPLLFHRYPRILFLLIFSNSNNDEASGVIAPFLVEYPTLPFRRLIFAFTSDHLSRF